jgi:HAMP domain-containing protein
MDTQERIARIEAELAELQSRMPKHSVPPAMIMEMEDLEDELEALRRSISRDSD